MLFGVYARVILVVLAVLVVLVALVVLVVLVVLAVPWPRSQEGGWRVAG